MGAITPAGGIGGAALGPRLRPCSKSTVLPLLWRGAAGPPNRSMEGEGVAAGVMTGGREVGPEGGDIKLPKRSGCEPRETGVGGSDGIDWAEIGAPNRSSATGACAAAEALKADEKSAKSSTSFELEEVENPIILHIPQRIEFHRLS